jgi:ankyrin repeat protein
MPESYQYCLSPPWRYASALVVRVRPALLFPGAAQFELAKQYGCSSWRALKAHVDSMTLEDQLIEAVRDGNVGALAALLDEHPDKLTLRTEPYEWSLLHTAAHSGQLAIVELLLQRGLDVNVREKGDNTYAMHWAAAAGHLEIVRRLADAGGDVIGRGDDHELEVIGWATCWDDCDDAAHRAIADFLVGRGAHHHIFSAISLNLADEVRRIVRDDPSALNRRMSRNENHRMPLHFAVMRNRPHMVSLLLELGADPLAVDGSGQPAALYATSPDVDTAVMEKIRALTASELVSAERGQRPARGLALDLVATVALRDWSTAERVIRENPQLMQAGVLHLMAKRNDTFAVKWLLDHGADPNVRWAHWDTDATPLHLAASQGHEPVIRLLLEGGADPSIRDTQHDSDASGWAEFFKHPEIVPLLRG